MRWIAPLTLIALSAGATSCAGHTPAPPEHELCLSMKDHYRCRRADGSHYSDPYPGRTPRIAMPVSDWEAERNWEAAVRR